jgi:cytochrome c oxidase subunit 5b
LVVDVLTSRLLLRARALTAQALRPMVSMGDPWLLEVVFQLMQGTGLQRETVIAAQKGLHPYKMLSSKVASGTKASNLVPSITNKRIMGYICKEDNCTVIWFWQYKGKIQ